MDKLETFVVDGKDYIVIKPNTGVMAAADRICRRTSTLAISRGAIRCKRLAEVLFAKGWGSEKQDTADSLMGKIHACEARDDPEGLLRLRMEYLDFTRVRTAEISATAEAQGLDAWFDFLVTKCLVHADSGKPVFANLKEYLRRKTERVAYEGASRLVKRLFGFTTESWRMEE